MPISNGFDTDKVKAALFGRVGWKQPTATGSITLSDANKKSVSGRHFQSFHPLVTPKNIRATMEDENPSDDDVNDYLVELQEQAIFQLLNGVFAERQLIQSSTIFERLRRNDNLLPNYGKFCGYRLWVAPGEFATAISRASFLFNGNASFTLYLFQDMVIDPIAIKAVTVTAFQETHVELEDFILRFSDTKVEGGVYYLGYFQDELNGVQAIDQFVSKWNQGLSLGYTGFEADKIPGKIDFNRNSVPYAFKTYGMNLQYQSFIDFTNKVVRNANMFDEAIGLTVCIAALELISYNTRSNQTERITKEMATNIYGEVNNSGSPMATPFVAGFKKRLEREIPRLQETFLHDPMNDIISTRPYEWASSANPMLPG